jgi:hypothetical protein
MKCQFDLCDNVVTSETETDKNYFLPFLFFHFFFSECRRRAEVQGVPSRMGDPFNEVQAEVDVAIVSLQSSSGWPARWVGLSVFAVPSVLQQRSDILLLFIFAPVFCAVVWGLLCEQQATGDTGAD